MVDRSVAALGARPGEKVFGVAETGECLPDALQVIAGCTSGNSRLCVLDAGRFAITMNRPSPGEFTDASASLSTAPRSRRFRPSEPSLCATRRLIARARPVSLSMTSRAEDAATSLSGGFGSGSTRKGVVGRTVRALRHPVTDTLLRGGVCAACGGTDRDARTAAARRGSNRAPTGRYVRASSRPGAPPRGTRRARARRRGCRSSAQAPP